MKIPFNKWGMTIDPIGAQVSMPYRGRILLGDVVDSYRREVPSGICLVVRHFNGEPWPFDPGFMAVDMLEREDDPGYFSEDD